MKTLSGLIPLQIILSRRMCSSLMIAIPTTSAAIRCASPSLRVFCGCRSNSPASSFSAFILQKRPSRRRDYHSRLHGNAEGARNFIEPTPRPLLGTSRSTSNPDEGLDRTLFADGRGQRRGKLHDELSKLGIDPNEIESHPERFGTAAIRTYNSFLLPKSVGALAVAESSTRPRVVANNISFLQREHTADQERWLINVDRNRSDGVKQRDKYNHPITIILDNVRSARNVGNILRLAEAAQVESVRLCGMTPRPPHPKVLKTAMGAAEYVSLGDGDESTSTLKTVLDLKAKGYKVIGVETTSNATMYWDTELQDDEDDRSIAYVFGNELIGVDVQVLRECDGIVRLPTYGMKNSLNVATCAGIVVWDRLRQLNRERN